MDICPLCGRKVVRTSKNVLLVDGNLCHKKCPKSKVDRTLSEQDKEDYKKLTDLIVKYRNECPKGFYQENPNVRLNFKALTPRIKKLKEQGYSYSDMIYALNECIDTQGGFWGFGSVENRIQDIIERKKQREEKENKLAFELEHKETFHGNKQVDLSKMLEEDDKW